MAEAVVEECVEVVDSIILQLVLAVFVDVVLEVRVRATPLRFEARGVAWVVNPRLGLLFWQRPTEHYWCIRQFVIDLWFLLGTGLGYQRSRSRAWLGIPGPLVLSAPA